MTELTTWLLEQIAADEAVARAAMSVHRRQVENLGDGKWGRDYLKPMPAEDVRRDVMASIPPGQSSPGDTWTDVPGSEHFKRFNPARVLAEGAARRRIVALHASDSIGSRMQWCKTCADWENNDYDGPPRTDWPCPTLRALASVYAGADGWREEWRP